MMREAGARPYADRIRGLIAVLWRAGLRISEALALAESDLDPKTRVGIGPRREGREATNGRDGRLGMGACRTLNRAPDPAARRSAVLHPRRPHPRLRMVSDRRPRRAPAALRAGRRAATVCAAPAPARARDRDGARRDPAADYPEAARACPPWDHVDLPPRNRYARDRGHGPPPPATGHLSERRPAAITTTTGGA